ncbi:Peptide hydrolase [Mycena sanguinolenta]|uniref:Peptide hydrolase n=1 Tax=Mycena sanguinolenta TaxID=230812 RepID=A0A8H6ZCU8_9AGAR|nr:Peptide hydrolase [Mycena sanguinolenta]
MLHPILVSLALVIFVAAQSGQTPLGLGTQNDVGPGFDLDSNELRLVQFSPNSPAEWVTEREKLQAKALGWDYMDITDTPFLGTLSKKPRFSYPSPSSTIVAGVLTHLSTAEPKANLEHFTSYHTRYYNSETGRASSEWLYAKILAYTAELANEEQQPLISVESVKHPWKQNSIIIRMSPLDASDSGPITILGAHIDSLNKNDPFGPVPSWLLVLTMTALGPSPSLKLIAVGPCYIPTRTSQPELLLALLVAGYIPLSPLEFHFYAGEEGGLRGSQAIASSYKAAGKAIRGMIQFDMTAFHKAGTREEIAVIANQVDLPLSAFLAQVIDKYLDIPWVIDIYPVDPTTGRESRSDHNSWTMAGYPSCHPLEGQFANVNPYVHTPDDRIDISPEFSFDHMLHFSKLAVAFAIEMSSY